MVTQLHYQTRITEKFPSPYGVIFILIYSFMYLSKIDCGLFPSPYGVSFILIKKNLLIEQKTSMSFRLLMELYSFLLKDVFYMIFKTSEFPSPYGVIFILMINV